MLLTATIQAYDHRRAQGQEYLHTVEDGKFRNEWYLFHVEVEQQRTLLMSDVHILLLKEGLLEWHCPIKGMTCCPMVLLFNCKQILWGCREQKEQLLCT